jgi:hypothetical protein
MKQRRFNGYAGESDVEYKFTLLEVDDNVTIFVGLSSGIINILSYIR